MNEEWSFVVNQVPIKLSTKEWLVREANKKGITIRKFAGLELDDLASEFIDSIDEVDDTTEAWDNFWFERQNRAVMFAKRNAAIYLSNPSDKMYERLERSCARAGMSVDEVVATVESSPFSALVAKEKVSTKRTECIMWLSDFLSVNGGEIDSSIVYAEAEEKGFSSSTLNRAKQDVNNDPDTPSITHGRNGSSHTWKIAER